MSVTVGYVLNLAIAALLLTGLFVAGGSLVESEREAAVEGELTVIGERLVADVQTVDRLVSASDDPDAVVVERRVELPERVSGTEYVVTVAETADGDDVLRLASDRVDVVVELPLRTDESVLETTVDGGDVTVRWDDEADPNGEDEGAVVIES